MDRIVIRDLLLRAIIGINPEEREKRQDVLITLTLEADLRAAGRSDAIEDTVNYRSLTKQVISLVEESAFYLVEKMADEIARLCLEDPRVLAVEVLVEKPGALRFAKSVGVAIRRIREDPGMTDVLISLGSNIAPLANLRAAVVALAEQGKIVAASPVYASRAVGPGGQPLFLNAAVWLRTDLSPGDLKSGLRRIEARLGRVRVEGDKYAPRTIDLDISLYGDAVLELEGRHIPDPELLRYAHIAVPLADIAPDWHHPEDGRTLGEIARHIGACDLTRLDATLWQPTSDPGKDKPMPPMIVNPSSYDAFRIDLEDVEMQECDGDIACAVRDILVAIGEDPNRQGLKRTPERVARAYQELTAGYHVDPTKLINDAVFDVTYDEMVIVRDIDYYSLCEHHLLPFMGQCHVGYIPDGKVIGLSKIPRIVEMYARRLQIQEQMTQQIAEFINETLHPRGVAVVCEGLHMCAAMRGVKKANARMVTSAMLGNFKTNQATRDEFLSNIGRSVAGG